ncbi:MAG: sugar kinase [Candidatus Bathyarchaeota archaeon]|nr:sugar kinase [Candidatus Bathyarchaeota archaeon]
MYGLLGEDIDVVCGGECIVDLIPIDRSVYKACFGGAPMNTAIACSRLGLRVGAITCIGNDPLGEFLVDTLRSNLVDLSRVRRSSLRTTLALVVKLLGGEVDYIFYRKPSSLSADTEYAMDEADLEYLSRARLLHVSGFAFSQDPARGEYLKLLSEARRMGVKTSLDPTFRMDVWRDLDEAYKVYRRLFSIVDIVLSTDRELKTLLGLTDVSKILDICEDYGWEAVGIKMGARGSILCIEGDVAGLESFKVDVVDTVGAGDAWNAAVIYGILNRLTVDETVLIANAVAAIKCTRIGAIDGLPTLEEAKRFISYTDRPKPITLDNY